jgi:hypothetical protein
VNVRGTPSGTTVTVNSRASGDVNAGNVANSLDDIQGPVSVVVRPRPWRSPEHQRPGRPDATPIPLMDRRHARGGQHFYPPSKARPQCGLAGERSTSEHFDSGDDRQRRGRLHRVLGTGARALRSTAATTTTINVGSRQTTDDISRSYGQQRPGSQRRPERQRPGTQAHSWRNHRLAVDRDGAAPITRGTVEILTVNGGSGGNAINIQSTVSTTPVVVTPARGDAIRVDDNGGPLDPPDAPWI